MSAKRREYTTEQIRKALDIPEDTFISENESAAVQIIAKPKPKKTKESNHSDAAKSTPDATDSNKVENGDVQPREGESKSKKKRRKKAIMKKKASSNKIELNIKLSESVAAEKAEDADGETKENSSEEPLSNSRGSEDRHFDDESPPNEKSRLCDIHFFSDTEIANSPCGSRPSTPIQSDSEFEISQRDNVVRSDSCPKPSTAASWKWGELPITPAKNDAEKALDKETKQAERNSTLSTMFSFMKETIKLRKNQPEGVYLSDLMDTENVDPEIVAMYFPQKPDAGAEDRESGHGTSLPLSPSSVPGELNACLEFDFEHDGKTYDK